LKRDVRSSFGRGESQSRKGIKAHNEKGESLFSGGKSEPNTDTHLWKALHLQEKLYGMENRGKRPLKKGGFHPQWRTESREKKKGRSKISRFKKC